MGGGGGLFIENFQNRVDLSLGGEDRKKISILEISRSFDNESGDSFIKLNLYSLHFDDSS